MDRYNPGELFVYVNGDRWELGQVKRENNDGTGYFCWYSTGDTCANTPTSCMHKLANAGWSHAEKRPEPVVWLDEAYDDGTERLQNGLGLSAAELLPCPFCGGEAETFNPFGKVAGTWCVVCCECACASGFEQTEAEAIDAWNSRAERTCKVEGVSADYGWLDDRDPIYVFTLSCGHIHDSLVNDQPRYCQICGAKVVSE